MAELVLYYTPVTLAACLVYASLKRPYLRAAIRYGLRYFVLFTLLVAVCVVVMEVLLKLFVDA